MFLQRIVIENVRSIEHLDLPITREGDVRQWTFLLGENGTGKTTVLRSIALVLGGSEALRELLGTPNDWVRGRTGEARIHADMVTEAGEQRTAELVIGADDTFKTVISRNQDALDELDRALAHSARNYFTVGYGVSRRPAETDTAITSGATHFRDVRANNVATLFSSHASLTSLEAWAMDLDYRDERGGEIVKEAMDRILPNVTMERIDREQRELLFRTADGVLPYRLLSEGYQNVAAWTGDLLYQISNVFEDRRQPFDARGLLLIDEVDLHLHPVWQRRVMAFVESRFPNFQVIATTHSPLTAHQAGEGELFFLRRPGAEGAAALEAYEGAPRDLMLQQLITSPAFGLTTLDSRHVAELKDEYRALRDLDGRDPEQEQRFRELSDQLEDLPDWSEEIEGQAEVKSLLRQVRDELARG